jgi:hypothetical protein
MIFPSIEKREGRYEGMKEGMKEGNVQNVRGKIKGDDGPCLLTRL